MAFYLIEVNDYPTFIRSNKINELIGSVDRLNNVLPDWLIISSRVILAGTA